MTILKLNDLEGILKFTSREFQLLDRFFNVVVCAIIFIIKKHPRNVETLKITVDHQKWCLSI